MAAYRILVVDDHAIVIAGYRELINRQSDLEVCAVASTTTQALQMAGSSRPDLAIVDLMLDTSDGLELVQELHARFPGLKTLVVSARDESLFAERALSAGASGYLSKAEASGRLVGCIRAVLGGERTQDPSSEAG